jgi:hypothetical protein
MKRTTLIKLITAAGALMLTIPAFAGPTVAASGPQSAFAGAGGFVTAMPRDTGATTLPEPATVGALALAGCAFLSRRRRHRSIEP